MAQEIEIEFKNLLTKSELEFVERSIHFPEKAIEQTNYYFETDDLSFYKAQAALRIRQIGDSYVITLKEPHQEGLLETHAPITKDQLVRSIESHFVSIDLIDQQLHRLQIPREAIKFQGSLKTVRKETTYKNCLLVLDISYYNNKTDYELELESSNYADGEQVFQDLLYDLSIPKRDTPNKVARFFASR